MHKGIPFRTYIWVVAVMMTLIGCAPASLTYKPSLLHFSTPEVSGGWGSGTAEFQIAANTPEYLLAPLYQNGAFNSVGLDRASYLDPTETLVKINAWLGVFENTDIYLGTDRLLGAKIQLLGGSRFSHEKGFKVALSAKGGTRINRDNGFFSSSLGRISSSSHTVDVIDVALNVGYRYNPHLLGYLNSFSSKNDVSGKLVGGGVVHEINVTSRSYGFLLGVNVSNDKNGFITFEIGRAQTTWLGLDAVKSNPLGASLGYAW